MNCESREKVAYGEQVFQFGNFERTFSSGFTMSVGEEEQQNTEHGFTIANKVHFINLSFKDFSMLDTDSTKGLYFFNSQRNERNSSVGIVFTCVRRSESVETSFTLAKDTLALALNFEEPRTEMENALLVEDKNVLKFYISTVGQGVPGHSLVRNVTRVVSRSRGRGNVPMVARNTRQRRHESKPVLSGDCRTNPYYGTSKCIRSRPFRPCVCRRHPYRTPATVLAIYQQLQQFEQLPSEMDNSNETVLAMSSAADDSMFGSGIRRMKESEEFRLDFRHLPAPLKVSFCPLARDREPLLLVISGPRFLVYKWNNRSARLAMEISCQDDKLTCGVWVIGTSPHCSTIVVGGKLGNLYMLRVDDKPSNLFHVRAHDNEICGLVELPEKVGAFLSASFDGSLKMFSARTGRCIRIFQPLLEVFEGITCTDLNLRQLWIAFGGELHSVNFVYAQFVDDEIPDSGTGTISLWPCERIRPPTYVGPYVSIKDMHQCKVKWIRWIGKFMASLSVDGRLQLWLPDVVHADPTSRSFVIDPKPIFHTNHIFSRYRFSHFAVNARKMLLAASSLTNEIRIWSLYGLMDDGRFKLVWRKQMDKEITDIQLNSWGDYLVVCTKPMSFIGWKITTIDAEGNSV
ncbi:WD domain, G-beta repeat protein [Trichinella nativa]|uniref:WD domain, G-beta repeat protein n=1 Tax=Trichinella nativa TaxID=6335 RepID=A0A1Y3ERG8_9BILA|nr:WD domain, G-beta repeat protein [Trichinella nativa]